MIVLIVVTIMLIGIMCVLAYTLAIYALPFMLALAATRFAYGTGAGWLGAGLVGLAAGAASFGVLAFLFAVLRAPILQIVLVVLFAAPAAVAGYALVHGITAEVVPSPVRSPSSDSRPRRSPKSSTTSIGSPSSIAGRPARTPTLPTKPLTPTRPCRGGPSVDLVSLMAAHLPQPQLPRRLAAIAFV